MTRRYITPPNFDIHKSAIDGDDEDPWGYSRLDRMDGLGKPLPTPYPASRAVANTQPPVKQKRARNPLWLGFWVPLVISAFVVGYLVVNGVPA